MAEQALRIGVDGRIFLHLRRFAPLLLLWRGIGGAGATTWAAQAIINLAMLLTHNWAWMVLAAQWIIIACWFALHIGRTNWAIWPAFPPAMLTTIVSRSGHTISDCPPRPVPPY